MEELLKEIEKWSEKYEFSFQFWGRNYNTVYISKDNIELYDTGGYETIEDVLKEALKWIYKTNNIKPKVVSYCALKGLRCKGERNYIAEVGGINNTYCCVQGFEKCLEEFSLSV